MVVISHGYNNTIVNVKSEIYVQKTRNGYMILELASMIDQNDLKLHLYC